MRSFRRGRPAPAATTPAADAVAPVGTVRRSQLVSTYGVGSVVDLERGSFMPMGLEDWDELMKTPGLAISEPRLQAMLGVNRFMAGPAERRVPGQGLVERRCAAPAVRFPAWQECPSCHRIGTQDQPFELSPDGTKLRCRDHGKDVETVPVRFVMACGRGHIEDFPWEWWAHRSAKAGICSAPRLFLKSRGKSASLADLLVECRSCGASQSMGDAFAMDVFPSCGGVRPWLHDREKGCTEKPRAIQRGASNVHFPLVCSALSIPPASEAVSQILEAQRNLLSALDEENRERVFLTLAQDWGVAVEALRTAWRQLSQPTWTAGLTERLARADEHAALSEDREDQIIGGVVPQFMSRVMAPPPSLQRWFDLIGAVSRLREVRALAGFSRIEPRPVAADRVADAIREGLIAPLSKAPPNWLPGVEILGEGIFLRFRTEAVNRWITANPQAVRRAEGLERRAAKRAADRGVPREEVITPRLLLVHSFAHAVLRQISLECGYASSALRERLYVAEAEPGAPAMNAVLIYTGSPDSEGSLGGLVRLADPDLIEGVVLRALQSAEWCGNDPVCIETDPAHSGDRLSGAACHSCLLLPETACERFNRELDRALLTGDPVGHLRGFFASQEET